MKITASVDELLVYFPNLNYAVSILIQGINEKRHGALYDWDEFRKKDAAQNTPRDWCEDVHPMLNRNYCSNCGRKLYG